MILITGASSGIGEACAKAFAQTGKDLILVARRHERLESIASTIRERFSVRVETFQIDVRDRGTVAKWADANQALLSEVTVLINNAGLAKGFDLIQDGKLDDWEMMIDTNVKGLLYVTRAILPLMIPRGDGHIVNLGSVAGYWTYPKGNVYCASKYAVRALTESLRLDLVGTGIRVTEIVPGMVETEFSEVRLEDTKKAKAVYAGMRPLTAEDIAETIAWCVNRPRHVNIQEVVVYPTDQASPTAVHRSK